MPSSTRSLLTGAVGSPNCARFLSPVERPPVPLYLLTEANFGAKFSQTCSLEDRRMDVGMMMVFASYGWDDCPDDRVWEEEIRLARLAADCGFDVLWSAEHHFNDYY